ncbi:hypothetical protein [Streptomyces sp. NPDC101115]|uniref:hypothetical protein n=1 Tax=Streptomyces sp. NPDC101115 TaxID=3366106 RepID=UPI003808AE6C
MRHVRRVGAAVVMTAAVVLVSGCSGGDGDSAKGSEVDPVVVSETPPVDVVAEPTTEEPVTEAPSTPATPQEELDALAAEKGWEVDDLYAGSASAFVEDICESLPTSGADSTSRPQWLAESGNFEEDGKAILQAGIPKLCPKWSTVLKQAVSGKYDRWFGNGTYVVSSKPAADGGDQTIPPGTYRAEGKMENCYWERTSESGDIIDNNFATSARKITITIRSSDGQFTSEGCTVWKPVK